MFPPDGVMLAARRWMGLLRHSSIVQAGYLLHSSAGFADHSPTQYALALEWLKATQLVIQSADRTILCEKARLLPESQLSQLLLMRSLEVSPPAWLADADILVTDASEVPEDLARLGDALNLSEESTYAAVREVYGLVDLELRKCIGTSGETALVELLEGGWPGSCIHRALEADGLGYDIEFRHADICWHIEVKTTTRRGRLALFLSRREFDVSQRDPTWKLVVIGLEEDRRLGALACVPTDSIWSRAPTDCSAYTKWESAKYELLPGDIEPGLGFIRTALGDADRPQLLDLGYEGNDSSFAWLRSS